MKKVCCVLAVLLLAAPLAFADFSLKLGGGFTTIQGDDYNKGNKGFVDYSRAYSDAMGGSYDGDLNGLAKMGMNFYSEAVFNFTPNIGVGLGVGYFQTQAKASDFYNDGVILLWWAEQTTSRQAKVSVIPINLNFHFTLPLSPAMGLDFFAGPGLYLTNFHYQDETDFDAWLLGIWKTHDYNATTDFKASKAAFGFQGGIGFEFNMTPSLSFFINGIFRYLSISDIMGDWEYTVEDNMGGTTSTETENNFYLWYYEFDFDGTDYPALSLGDASPASGARHAKINLTGFSVLGGIKFRFGAI